LVGAKRAVPAATAAVQSESTTYVESVGAEDMEQESSVHVSAVYAVEVRKKEIHPLAPLDSE
jgi:hypothetical protein